jgi:hypothetical protein
LVSRGVKFLEKRRENVQIFQALRWRFDGGLWEKNYFGWSGVYFIFILHYTIIHLTSYVYHRFLRQRLLLKYQNVVWSIICPLEVRCLTPLSKIFQLLLLWRKLEYPEKSTDLSQVTDKLIIINSININKTITFHLNWTWAVVVIW